MQAHEPITSKQQYYVLAKRHLFGNQLRIWPTLYDAIKDNYFGPFGIRISKGHNRFFACGLSYAEVQGRLRVLSQETSVSWDDLIVQESAPHNCICLQGEVIDSDISPGIVLTYSTIKDHMRAAMVSPKTAHGLKAINLLKANLTPSSYDDMRELLELYPGHVVEFTSFDHPIGEFKGRNTVIWEVRRY